MLFKSVFNEGEIIKGREEIYHYKLLSTYTDCFVYCILFYASVLFGNTLNIKSCQLSKLFLLEYTLLLAVNRHNYM